MKRLYTRTGDAGTTGIHGGTRVPKDDIRVEAGGTLDELNCQIGVIRSMMDEASFENEVLQGIQANLMTVMSLVATPSGSRDKNPNSLPEDLVPACEALLDKFTEAAGDSSYFLLPGGTPVAAQLQLARAVCRRAERRLWTLHREDPVPEAILKYINRLSDLFFIMARCELVSQDWPEERWKAFTYKNRR